MIDMGLYEEAQMFSTGRDTFPLVVRLETVTEKGKREGHTLHELRCGGDAQCTVDGLSPVHLGIHPAVNVPALVECV